MATKTISKTVRKTIPKEKFVRVAAKDAKNRFGELLEAAQRHTVIITRNNRPVAELRRFPSKTRFEEVEDQLWLEKVAKVMKNPQFIGVEKTAALIAKYRNV